MSINFGKKLNNSDNFMERKTAYSATGFCGSTASGGDSAASPCRESAGTCAGSGSACSGAGTLRRARRRSSGFTLSEILMTVAILAVLFALAVPGVALIKHRLKIRELDDCARQIFIAAQNGLTAAEAAGKTEEYKDYTKYNEETGVLAPNPLWYNKDDESLASVIPDYAIEGQLAANNYAVKLDFNTATVLEVVYSELQPISKDSADSYTGDAKESRRYDDYVGWFDGSNLDGHSSVQYIPLEVSIENGNDLLLDIRVTTFDAIDSNRIHRQIKKQLEGKQIDFQIKVFELDENGNRVKVDGKDKFVELYSAVSGEVKTPYSAPFSATEGAKCQIVLDSLTEGKRFKDICKGLTPGADIEVEVLASCQNTAGAKFGFLSTVKRASGNSLFDSIYYGKAAADISASPAVPNQIAIANPRHLQNLGANVSGVAIGSETKKWDVVQTAEIDWDTAEELVSIGDGTSADPSSGSETGLKKIDFIPIKNDSLDNYYNMRDAKKIYYPIRNLRITNDPSAYTAGLTDVGLFSVYSGSRLNNIQLINPSISTAESGTSATTTGALAGKTVGTAVNGCHMWLDSKDASGVAIPEFDYTSYILSSSASHVGGLIGEVSGGSVKKSSASWTGISATAENAYAGGLVGYVSAAASSGTTGKVTVEQCYADTGLLSEKEVNVGTEADPKMETVTVWNENSGILAGSWETSSEGEVQIKGTGTAGGLIGKAEGVSVEDSYAMGYVARANNAGGFVGASDGNSSNTADTCYSLVYFSETVFKESKDTEGTGTAAPKGTSYGFAPASAFTESSTFRFWKSGNCQDSKITGADGKISPDPNAVKREFFTMQENDEAAKAFFKDSSFVKREDISAPDGNTIPYSSCPLVDNEDETKYGSKIFRFMKLKDIDHHGDWPYEDVIELTLPKPSVMIVDDYGVEDTVLYDNGRLYAEINVILPVNEETSPVRDEWDDWKSLYETYYPADEKTPAGVNLRLEVSVEELDSEGKVAKNADGTPKVLFFTDQRDEDGKPLRDEESDAILLFRKTDEDTSDNSFEFKYEKTETEDTEPVVIGTSFRLYLDKLSADPKDRFSSLCAGLTPGANIRVKAQLVECDYETYHFKQAEVKEGETEEDVHLAADLHNSLFYSSYTYDKTKTLAVNTKAFAEANPVAVARVASTRHLQNLNTATSGLNAKTGSGIDNTIVSSAKQIGNIDWALAKDYSGQSKEGRVDFAPIINNGLGSFVVDSVSEVTEDTDKYQIRNLRIREASAHVTDSDTADYAGLFGYFSGNGESNKISGVRLINAYLNSYGEAVGALAGKTVGTEVSDCRVYFECSSSKEYYEYDLNGNSSAYVGGLIGFVDGGSLSSCFASWPTAMARGAYLGGLVGFAKGEDSVPLRISNCYADTGLNMKYADSDEWYWGESLHGTGVVGGLAGHASAAEFTDCYAMGYISAASIAAGFVGDGNFKVGNCFSYMVMSLESGGPAERKGFTAGTVTSDEPTDPTAEQITYKYWKFSNSQDGKGDIHAVNRVDMEETETKTVHPYSEYSGSDPFKFRLVGSMPHYGDWAHDMEFIVELRYESEDKDGLPMVIPYTLKNAKGVTDFYTIPYIYKESEVQPAEEQDYSGWDLRDFGYRTGDTITVTIGGGSKFIFTPYNGHVLIEVSDPKTDTDYDYKVVEDGKDKYYKEYTGDLIQFFEEKTPSESSEEETISGLKISKDLIAGDILIYVKQNKWKLTLDFNGVSPENAFWPMSEDELYTVFSEGSPLREGYRTEEHFIYDEGLDLDVTYSPAAEGKAFRGWYSDEELTKKTENVVFSCGSNKKTESPFDGADQILYAKWEEANTYTVSVFNNSESPIYTGWVADEEGKKSPWNSGDVKLDPLNDKVEDGVLEADMITVLKNGEIMDGSYYTFDETKQSITIPDVTGDTVIVLKQYVGVFNMYDEDCVGIPAVVELEGRTYLTYTKDEKLFSKVEIRKDNVFTMPAAEYTFKDETGAERKPENDDYFLGWTVGEPKEESEVVPPEQTAEAAAYSTEFYPVWKEYELNYVMLGGVLAEETENPQAYTIKDTLKADGFALPAEEKVHRDGYAFDGWYAKYTEKTDTDPETYEDGPITSLAVGHTGDTSVYAKWNPYLLTINLVTAKGVIPETEGITRSEENKKGKIESVYGNTVMLPKLENLPEAAFKGWKIVSVDPAHTYEKDEEFFRAEEEYPLNKDGQFCVAVDSDWTVTLEAVWNSCTVSFYRETTDTEWYSQKIVAEHTSVGTEDFPDDPVKEGFSFAGWYKDPDTWEERFESQTLVEEDISVFAKWDRKTLTVRFYDLEVRDDHIYDLKTVGYGDTIASGEFPENPTRTGYTFNGWYIFENGSITGTQFTDSTVVAEDMNILAAWEKNSWTVTFVDNTHHTVWGAAHVAPVVERVLVERTVGSLPAAPAVAGYRFDGWYTESGSLFSGNTAVTGDITVYAKWTPDTWTARFYDLNRYPEWGKSDALVGTQVLDKANPVVVLPVAPATMTGYTLKWYTDRQYKTEFNSGTTIRGDIDLFARWTKNSEIKYKVTVIGPNGKIGEDIVNAKDFWDSKDNPLYNEATQGVSANKDKVSVVANGNFKEEGENKYYKILDTISGTEEKTRFFPEDKGESFTAEDGITYHRKRYVSGTTDTDNEPSLWNDSHKYVQNAKQRDDGSVGFEKDGLKYTYTGFSYDTNTYHGWGSEQTGLQTSSAYGKVDIRYSGDTKNIDVKFTSWNNKLHLYYGEYSYWCGGTDYYSFKCTFNFNKTGYEYSYYEPVPFDHIQIPEVTSDTLVFLDSHAVVYNLNKDAMIGTNIVAGSNQSSPVTMLGDGKSAWQIQTYSGGKYHFVAADINNPAFTGNWKKGSAQPAVSAQNPNAIAGKEYENKAPNDEKVILFNAEWTETVQVTFKTNNNTDAIFSGPTQVVSGTSADTVINGLSSVPAWDGHRFAGWCKAGADGTVDWNTVYDGSSKELIGADTVFYAKWLSKITLHKNDGEENDICYENAELITHTVKPDGTVVTAGDTFGQAISGFGADPVREGYIFDGWYTKGEDGELDKKYTSESSDPITGDVDLFSKWNKNQAKATFYLDVENSIVYAEKTVDFDVEIGQGIIATKENPILNPDAPDGMVFSGWYKKGEDGELDKTTVYNGTTKELILIDTDFYADFQPMTFAVYFRPNGGSGSMADQIINTKNGAGLYCANLTPNTFEKTGYRFVNWNTEAHPSEDVPGAAYFDKAEITGEAGETVTLYAQWAPNSYTVKFDPNGGDGTMEDMSLQYDQEPVALTRNSFTNGENMFLGWNTVKAPSETEPGKFYKDGEEVANLTDEHNKEIVLYAQWKEKQHIPAPTVEILGDETEGTLASGYGYQDQLVAKVSLNPFKNEADMPKNGKYQLTVTVKGVTSCKEYVALTESFEAYPEAFSDGIMLDSLTEGNRFKDIFSELIPGENITVTAHIELTGPEYEIGKYLPGTAEEATNSLFAYKDGDTAKALVATRRHLQNLAMNVSGVNADGTEAAVSRAEQLCDVNWSGESSEYIPSVNGNLTEYDGKNNTISNISVNAESGNAGLFGTVSGSMSIHELKLEDCSFAAVSGNAGSLVGEAKSGTLMIDSVLSTSKDCSVTASGVAGGLVGLASTSVTVINSASNVRVGIGAEQVAGGLIGQLSNGALCVENSYVGGHTSNGTYVSADWNIQGSVAGGILGSAEDGTTVEMSNTFNAASVWGDSFGGGIIGEDNSQSDNLSYVYVVSLVGQVALNTDESSSDTSFGAFIGATSHSDDNRINAVHCYYLPEIYSGSAHKELTTRSGKTITVSNVTYIGGCNSLTADVPFCLTESVQLAYYDKEGENNIISATHGGGANMQVKSYVFDNYLSEKDFEYPFAIWTSFAFDGVNGSGNGRTYGTYYGDWQPVVDPQTQTGKIEFFYIDPILSIGGDNVEVKTEGKLSVQKLFWNETNKKLLLPYIRSFDNYSVDYWELQYSDGTPVLDGDDPVHIEPDAGQITIEKKYCSGGEPRDLRAVAHYQREDTGTFSVFFYYDPDDPTGSAGSGNFRLLQTVTVDSWIENPETGEKRQVTYDDVAKSAEFPAKARDLAGKFFDGWFSDRTLSDEKRVTFEGNTGYITEDISVFARYSEIQMYTVTLDFVYQIGTHQYDVNNVTHFEGQNTRYTITKRVGERCVMEIPLPVFSGYKVNSYMTKIVSSEDSSASITLNPNSTVSIDTGNTTNYEVIYCLESDVSYKLRYILKDTTPDANPMKPESWNYKKDSNLQYFYSASGASGGDVYNAVGDEVPRISIRVPDGFSCETAEIKYLKNSSGDYVLDNECRIIELEFKRNEYALLYALNGGTADYTSSYFKFGEPITAPETNPRRTGYAFDGWNLRISRVGPDGTVTEESLAWNSPMPANTVVATAKWKPSSVSFTVEYMFENIDDDGFSYAGQYTVTGKASSGDTVYSKDYATPPLSFALQSEIKSHFTHDASRDTSVIVKSDGSAILPVYFKRNIYSIKFYERSGSGRGAEIPGFRIEGKYGTVVPASRWPEMVNGRYRSSFWQVYNLKNSKMTSYYQGNIAIIDDNYAFVKQSTMVGSGEAYYYLESLDGKMVLDHTDRGGTSGAGITDDDKYQIQGFTFDEVVDSSGRVTKTWNGARFRYRRNTYTLDLSVLTPDGVKITKVEKKYQEPISKPEPDPASMEGFEFSGWYSDASFVSGSEFIFTDNTKMPAGNMALYGKWVGYPCWVELKLSPGEYFPGSESESVRRMEYQCRIGEPIGAQINEESYMPRKTGYTFMYWQYEDAEGEKHPVSADTLIQGESAKLIGEERIVTLTPYWIKNVNNVERTVTVKYLDMDDGELFPSEIISCVEGVRTRINAKDCPGYVPDKMGIDYLATSEEDQTIIFRYHPIEKWGYKIQYYVDYSSCGLSDTEKQDLISALGITDGVIIDNGCHLLYEMPVKDAVNQYETIRFRLPEGDFSSYKLKKWEVVTSSEGTETTEDEGEGQTVTISPAAEKAERIVKFHISPDPYVSEVSDMFTLYNGNDQSRNTSNLSVLFENELLTVEQIDVGLTRAERAVDAGAYKMNGYRLAKVTDVSGTAYYPISKNTAGNLNLQIGKRNYEFISDSHSQEFDMEAYNVSKSILIRGDIFDKTKISDSKYDPELKAYKFDVAEFQNSVPEGLFPIHKNSDGTETPDGVTFEFSTAAFRENLGSAENTFNYAVQSGTNENNYTFSKYYGELNVYWEYRIEYFDKDTTEPLEDEEGNPLVDIVRTEQDNPQVIFDLDGYNFGYYLFNGKSYTEDHLTIGHELVTITEPEGTVKRIYSAEVKCYVTKEAPLMMAAKRPAMMAAPTEVLPDASSAEAASSVLNSDPSSALETTLTDPTALDSALPPADQDKLLPDDPLSALKEKSEENEDDEAGGEETDESGNTEEEDEEENEGAEPSEDAETSKVEEEKHIHTEEIDEAVPATCTEDGLMEGTHCSVCGEVLTAQEAVPAFGHTEVIDEAVPATCAEDGLTEGTHCSVCGEVLVAQEALPALGHTEEIDEAVPATCTESGLTEGTHCSVCDEVLIAQEKVPALGHTEVIDEAVPSTCTEAGLTEGSHCAVCDEVFIEQEMIPAAHTVVIDEAVEPTWTEFGWTEGSHCEVCGEVFVQQEEILPLEIQESIAEAEAFEAQVLSVISVEPVKCTASDADLLRDLFGDDGALEGELYYQDMLTADFFNKLAFGELPESADPENEPFVVKSGSSLYLMLSGSDFDHEVSVSCDGCAEASVMRASDGTAYICLTAYSVFEDSTAHVTVTVEDYETGFDVTILSDTGINLSDEIW